MPALSPIVLNDGTNDHTFAVEGMPGGVATFGALPTSGVFSHRSVLQSSKRAQSEHLLQTLKLRLPHLYVDSDTGEESAESFDEVIVQFRTRKQSVAADRDLLVSLAGSMIAVMAPSRVVNNEYDY